MKLSTRHRLPGRLSGACAGLALLACFSVAVSPIASADAQPRTYVALGDSFSSGEGLDSYEAGTDTKKNTCHRSILAYPQILHRRYPEALSTPTFGACSGATTRDIFWKKYNEPPQVNRITSSTDVITLTLGGNDIGFEPTIEDCVFTTLVGNGAGKVKGRPGCKRRNNRTIQDKLAYFASDRKDSTSQFAPNMPLELVLKRLHDRAPNAEIYVAGYPELINPVDTESISWRGVALPACSVGAVYPKVGGVYLEAPLFITASDAQWLHDTAHQLNKLIAKTVDRAKGRGIPVHYANVAPLFDGHLVCETSDPWVNGVVVPTGATTPDRASFHPTLEGQNQYATALSWAMFGFPD